MAAFFSGNYPENKSQSFKELFSRTWVQILVLLVFCVFLFLLGIGRWDLWNPDEPRYAQVAKEIVDGGDWILMHVNGKIYGDKPPLFFWLIGLSSYLWGGFTSFSVRFPSALLSTLTVLLTFLLGKKLYSSRTGLFSGLILATSFEFVYLSTRGNIDATVTFFTTLSIFCFFLWYQRNKENKDSHGKMEGLLFYGFYTGMALATLAKGPVGFIIPLLVSLVYLATQKEWKSMRGMRLLHGMPLLIAIVLCWYIPAVLSGGKSYLMETLFKHTVDAYAGGWTHVQPFYYYFVNFPADFLPWFLFFPGAIALGLFQKKEETPKSFLFPLVWFVSIFLFFSFSKGKRPIYLLPLYPAASLLVGRLWDTYLTGGNRYSIRKIWISLPVSLLAISFFLTGIVLILIPVVARFSAHPSTTKVLSIVIKKAGMGATYLSFIPYESFLLIIAFFLAMGLVLSSAYHFNRRTAVFAIIVVVVGIGFFYGTRVIFPFINPYKSARYLSEEIRQTMKPGERLAMYGDFGSGGTAPYNFYTGIVPILEIKGEKEAIDFLSSKERVLCILRYRDYEELSKGNTSILLRLLVRKGIGHNEMALVSNLAPSADSSVGFNAR